MQFRTEAAWIDCKPSGAFEKPQEAVHFLHTKYIIQLNNCFVLSWFPCVPARDYVAGAVRYLFLRLKGTGTVPKLSFDPKLTEVRLSLRRPYLQLASAGDV